MDEKDNKLISIVVPVYNTGKFLRRCVDSIIVQTYKNIEIILVDDGSTDDSSVICNEYSEIDTRVKVIHKENGGLSDARNVGVQYSNGEYIMFVDSDDYVAKNIIDYLYQLIVQYDAEIACCNRIKTAADNIVFTGDETIQCASGKAACELLLTDLYEQLVPAWAKLYERTIVCKSPFPFGRKHEDEATTAKYMYSAQTVTISNAVLYAYYDNPNGIMRTIGEDFDADCVWAFEERAEYFEKLHEIKLARLSWGRLYMYLMKDSLENHGRCDSLLRECFQWNRLIPETFFRVPIYILSPKLYVNLRKIVRWFKHGED